MNKLIFFSILITAILGLFSKTVLSLKCYVCNSKENPKCLDPRNETDPLPLTNCMTDTKLVNETKGSIQAISDLLTKVGQGSPSIYSNKKSSDFWNDDNFPMVCQKIEIEVQGKHIIGRGCSAPKIENFDPCEALKLIKKSVADVKSCLLCDTDGCNKGVREKAAFVPGILAIMVSAYVIT